jgi:hypothetical protein
VLAIRTLASSLPAAIVPFLAVAVTACGGPAGPANAEHYPFVDASSPATPTGYETDPSPSCERAMATFHDGSEPAKRPVVIAPAPGLRAVAVTEHTIRLEWSFHDLPDDCRPVQLLVSVVARGQSPPTTERLKIDGVAGSAELTYPDFLSAPDVALASAYSREGHRSRTVAVLIRRSSDTPPDPPEPAPNVTAPAAQLVSCREPATVVDDPAGDVLTYAVGSPPTPVRELTAAMSRIDLTRARFQIDGLTVCATFVFAEPPASENVQVTLTLRDVDTPSCCASLRFRGTAGALEVGHFTVDANGAYRLAPVPNAGASLRGKTLIITGTLPPPSAWQLQSRRIPAAEDIGWSVSTAYSPEKHGRSYGDWLPGYQEAGEPVIRHRDGATVTPGAAGGVHVGRR